MKTDLKSGINLSLAVTALSIVLVPGAMACGSLAIAGRPAGPLGLAAPHIIERGLDRVLPSLEGQDSRATGLWKIVLTSAGSVVMVEFDTWHSDGTELALDGLFPPATGNVCPGVWEKTGPRSYETVHPAFEYDNAGLNVIAIFIERMHVTLSQDGNSMEGTFTWDNYDFQGNLLPGSLSGSVAATRIEVSSKFPFPFPL